MANALYLNQAPVKTPHRELHNYISEISEHANVRADLLCHWEHRKLDEVLISRFSAVMLAACD